MWPHWSPAEDFLAATKWPLATYHLGKHGAGAVGGKLEATVESRMEIPQNLKNSWAPVAHSCNPSYSGCRDQEDLGLKPAPANSLQDPISTKNNTKKGLVE
jgi:hypothetical protein